jgi:hypothetical protein
MRGVITEISLLVIVHFYCRRTRRMLNHRNHRCRCHRRKAGEGRLTLTVTKGVASGVCGDRNRGHYPDFAPRLVPFHPI